MDHYQHQPVADDEIRVLDLLPDGAEEVRCRIRHVRLSDEPDYEALSYCWGDSSGRREINCDGLVMEITQSLYSFFSSNRYPQKPRTIWADAVCINQSDTSERNAQVRLMDRIYSKASNVLVWLGEASDGSDEAMNLINHLANTDWNAYDNQTWVPADPKSIPDDLDPVWLHLAALLNREYFHRMWIVQEVALAQSCIVLCGAVSVEWEHLHWASLQLRRASLNNKKIQVLSMSLSVSPIAAINLARKEIKDAEPQRPLSLLSRHRASRATDPRDRIYALYGLLPQDFQDLGLQPKYDIDTTALYLQVAKAILEKSQNLDIFSIPRTTQSVVSAAGKLPSWVPDWSQHIQVNSILGLEYPCAKRHRASQSSVWQPSFSSDLQRLLIEGYTVDTITKSMLVKSPSDSEMSQTCSSSSHDIKGSSRSIKDRDKHIRTLDRLIKATSKKPYRTGDPRMDVVVVTMCAGIHEDGYQHAEKAYYKYRRSRRLPTWLSLANHVVPIPLLLQCAASANKRLGVDFRVEEDALTSPDTDFATYDRSIGRQVFRTKTGYIGLGPPLGAVGDRIVLCKGGRLPLVLRKAGESWELLGDCYIWGMVKGELWDEKKCQPMWIA